MGPVYPTYLESLFFKFKVKVLLTWGSYFQQQVASAGLHILPRFGNYFPSLCWRCCSFPMVHVVPWPAVRRLLCPALALSARLVEELMPGESCSPRAWQNIYRREYDLPFLEWLIWDLLGKSVFKA